LEGRFTPDTKLTETVDHTCKINECKLKKDENTAVLYGSYTVSLLCKTEERYENIDLTESFEEQISELDASFDICDIDCRPLEVGISLTPDGNIDTKMICSLKLTPKAYRTFSAVTDIVTSQEERDNYNLIFCYPSSKDDLWNIAKRYFVDPEELRADNPENFNAVGELISRLPIIIKR